MYLPSMFSKVILTPRGVRSGSPLGNPSTGFPFPPPFTCRPRTATSPFSANFSAGFCCCCWLVSLLLLLGKGLEEERSGKEEKESKGRVEEEEEVGRGLLVGRGLVGPLAARRSSGCERWGGKDEEVKGRGLETIWMGWMSRMVPGVEAIDTGEAVTVLRHASGYSWTTYY